MKLVAFISVVASLVLCGLDLASAYPSKAPDSACDSMRPGHTNKTTGVLLEPKWSEHHFYIVVSKTYDIYPGEAIEVTLWTKDYDYDKNYFKGFLVQAHHPGSNIWDPYYPPMKHGEFYSYMDDTQLACESKAVCHSTEKRYEMAKFYWLAPEVHYDEEFQFVATVVMNYDHIFMDIRSDSVWVMGHHSQTDSASGLAATSMAATLLVAMATTLFR